MVNVIKFYCCGENLETATLLLVFAENIDYGPNILPANSTLSLIDNSSCHSLPVYDDEGVEPPETFTVTIIPTGPSSEFVALFDVTMLETTVVEIIDNDSE